MTNTTKTCSIIIRTKDEERWITPCLTAVFNQDYPSYEVILVDNNSKDKTLEKARRFPLSTVLTIDEFMPGAALNTGIRASKGEYIVCLSGHCIPTEETWLSNLVSALEESPDIAGAYGRQEPMDFSSPADKRDLLLVFGLDKKIQKRDSFFHNANSILKKECWELAPFDENATNIEDRLWGREMISRGYSLVYTPDASVYHYHGIHQNGNIERCENVARILESMETADNSRTIDIGKLNIIALIPMKGPGFYLNGQHIITYSIQHAIQSSFLSTTFVTTDDETIAQIAIQSGAQAPFLRPENLSKDYIGLEAVYKYSLEMIEQQGNYPDLICMLEPTFPFRQPGLIDKIIRHTVKGGWDSVMAARRESGSLWQEKKSTFERLDSGYAPREYKEKAYSGLKGLCIVTHPQFVREERLLGHKVGLYEITNPFSAVEIRSEEHKPLAETLLADWEKSKSS